MVDSIRSLDYVVLLCDDLETARRFYADVLSFSVYRDWDDWVEFQVGATLLTLRERGRPVDGPSPPAASVAVQLAFRVPPPDVDRCHRELREHGVDIVEEPRTQEYGHRTLFFRDSEGNLLEIFADV